ncbi:MAG: hypothetical protein AAGI46_08400 [Planctomycetota bacterium]
MRPSSGDLPSFGRNRRGGGGGAFGPMEVAMILGGSSLLGLRRRRAEVVAS